MQLIYIGWLWFFSESLTAVQKFITVGSFKSMWNIKYCELDFLQSNTGIQKPFAKTLNMKQYKCFWPSSSMRSLTVHSIPCCPLNSSCGHSHQSWLYLAQSVWVPRSQMHYLGLIRSTSHLKTQPCKETSKRLTYNLQSLLQISVIVHIGIWF